jgi:hypothetical protein
MPTNLEHLQTLKTSILAKLNEVIAAGSTKPTYSLDGQVVSWTEYQDMLMRQLANINNLINAEEPYEHRSYGYS